MLAHLVADSRRRELDDELMDKNMMAGWAPGVWLSVWGFSPGISLAVRLARLRKAPGGA